jgi:hypothetical protein
MDIIVCVGMGNIAGQLAALPARTGGSVNFQHHQSYASIVTHFAYFLRSDTFSVCVKLSL